MMLSFLERRGKNMSKILLEDNRKIWILRLISFNNTTSVPA